MIRLIALLSALFSQIIPVKADVCFLPDQDCETIPYNEQVNSLQREEPQVQCPDLCFSTEEEVRAARGTTPLIKKGMISTRIEYDSYYRDEKMSAEKNSILCMLNKMKDTT